ncbi:hypothetical protein PFISCL1PPCAC_22232, partial [Pristionchus fissidentatus]
QEVHTLKLTLLLISATTLSDLTNLPSDVIRQIIGLRSDEITTMKMISRSWYKLVTEYINESRNKPKIDAINFY